MLLSWLAPVLVQVARTQSITDLEKQFAAADDDLMSSGGLVAKCTFLFSGFTIGAENGPYLQSTLVNDNAAAFTHLRMSTWLFHQDERWNIGFLSEKSETNSGVRARQVNGTRQLYPGVEVWEENVAVFTFVPVWQPVHVNISNCDKRSKMRPEDCKLQNRERHVAQVESCGHCLPGFAGEAPPSETWCSERGAAGISLRWDERTCTELVLEGFRYQQWINGRTFYLLDFKFPSGAIYKTRAFSSDDGSYEGLIYFCPAMDAWHVTAARPKAVMATGGSPLQGYDRKQWDQTCYLAHHNCERIQKARSGFSMWKLNQYYPLNENVTCTEQLTLRACADICDSEVACKAFQFFPSPKEDYSYCAQYNHRVERVHAEFDADKVRYDQRVAALLRCETSPYVTYNKMAWFRNGGFEEVPFSEADKSMAGIEMKKRGVDHWLTKGQVFLGSNTGGLFSSNQGDYHVWMTTGGDYIEQTIFVPLDYTHVIVFAAAHAPGSDARIAVELNNIEVFRAAPDPNGFMTYVVVFDPRDVAAPEVIANSSEADKLIAYANRTLINGTMVNGSMANGTMTNLSHALAANDTVITGTMANDTMTDIAALNDTSPNATTTAEEKVEDALPPRGMIRVRFVHATVGAGDLYVDHISISSSDGAIGGHFDDIINGECPYFARTAERHPSMAKNYFEANRTDLWPSDSATTSGVNVERPAAKLHAVDNLTIHCGYGGELRESATGLCTGDVLFTAACTSVLIALGSVSAGVCCFVLLAYRCIRRSRRIDDAEMAVDVKLGFVDFQDRRCPPELRARTHGQMLVVKKFGEVHPEHRLMPWQTERLKDDNEARQKKEKKEIESMQKRSVVRSIMNLARHAIQGPAKPARVYPIALEPAVGVSRAYHTKIGGDEELDDENEYAVKMAKSKMDPERHTNITTYRVPRCPSREEVLAPPAKIMEIRDTSLRWESPIRIDLVKDVVKSGIGGRDGGTFPYYVPRHGFFDRGRSDVLSLILNVDGVEYRVEQQPREAFSVPRAPRRLFTKIFREHHLVGEIDKELAPWSEVEDLFLGTWRNVAHRPACRLRDDEGTTLCVVHAAKGRGLRLTPWHDEYAEIFKLVDGDGDACGTVEMRYKSWMGFLTPQAASIDMRPCNDKETEMLLAFGLVFGLAYQRNQRRDSFPSIRGVLVPKRRQGHTYEPNPKSEN